MLATTDALMDKLDDDMALFRKAFNERILYASTVAFVAILLISLLDISERCNRFPIRWLKFSGMVI